MEDRMKKLILTFLGVMLMSPSAFAAGYGQGGCGLGSMIFGDQAGPVQILAATTNGTSLNQAFGISSGTSNCDASGVILAEKEGDLFVSQNFASLEKEMAAGEGEHLDTLAGLLGCPSVKGPQFASYAQENYQTIFASEGTTPNEMLKAVKVGMAERPELAAACIH